MKPAIILTRSISSLLALGVVGATIQSASAANIWDGGGTTDLWSDVLNWDNDAFPTYGTLTFAGATRTTNIVDANINMNMLLWTGASPWTLNNSGGAVISLFDNGGVQAKVENQSSGLVTINAPVTFAATAGANWGEINAVNGGLTFGTGTTTVSGSGVNGIRMFGAGQTTTFNNTVSATGKYFATTAASAGTVEVGGAFTSGDFYLMNGSTLKLNSGGSLTTSGLRLGGDFGTTGFQNLTLGATFQLTSLTGGQTFASNINSVTGNTSGALLVDSLNTSGTNTLSGSLFLDSPLRLQVAAGGTLAVTGVVSNGSSLTKQGNGTLTLSNTNTYGGGTTLAAGTLNLGAAGALGSGALTVSGNSTLNNTSGGAIVTPTAKALNVNADLTFTGSNNLSFNLGTLTFGGAVGTRTISVGGSATLAVGLMNSSAGVNVTKTGTGILAMGDNSLANTSTINGVLDIQAGKVQMNSDLTIGGLTGSGTIENGGLAGKWLFVNQTTDTSFSGTISDGPNPATVRLGLVKRGTGTLDLSNAAATHTVSDRFVIENGTVRLAGTLTGGFAAGDVNRMIAIGNVASQNGRLIIDGGTLNAPRTASPSLSIGPGANARGFVTMTSGTINTANQYNIGNGSAATGTRAYAVHTQSGGTLNSGNWLVVGANFDRAVLNQSGGTINVLANRMTIGAGGNESHGIYNISGGTLNVTAGANTGIFLGENGRGILTLSGTGAINLNTNGTAPSGTMQFAGNNSSLGGQFNLNGGTLTTFGVTKGGTSTADFRFNFNGGTLRANANNTAFFGATGTPVANTTAYVFPGGAFVDSNGFSITMGQALVAPLGHGVTSIPVTVGGTGYLDTPHVFITGGSGNGATAVANVSGGSVTSITITNPGSNYLPTDVLTITLFGGGGTGATVGAATFAANTNTGGLTKNGAGTLTIGSTTSSYGGPTTINAGTLSIASIANGGANSSLGASSSAAANLVLNNATLQYTGATASSDRAFTLATGSTGTIDVTNSAATLTISGASAATNGNLVKTGPGTLALTATPGHTGSTTVNSGILGLTGTLAGPVSVGAGRLNAVHQAVGSLTVPTLTLGSGSGVDFDFGVGQDIITISNVGGLTLGTTGLNLYVAGGALPFTTNGTYPLFDYNTSFTGSLLGAFTVLNSQPGKIYSIANNLVATTIDLTINDALVTEWGVDANGTWTPDGNWTNTSPNVIGATATFGTIATAPRTITVDAPKTVGNIVFNNTNGYTISGGSALTLDNGLGTAMVSATSGSHAVNAPVVLVNPSAFSADTGATLTVGGNVSGSALSKSGAGLVILTGTNSHTTTNVTNGTLQIGNAGTTGTLGSGAVTIGTGATLAFNRSNALGVANNISGAGNLAQTGSGTTTYIGTATHTGATNITGGSLLNQGTINGTSGINVSGTGVSFVNEGSITAGGLSVQSGANATFQGAGGGAANGVIAVGTTGTGASLTLNTTGTLTTASTSNINIGVGAGTSGTLTVNNGTFTQTGAFGFAIGANGGTGTFNMTGGTINTGTSAQGFQLGVGTAGSSATATMSGGIINSTNEFWISNTLGNSATMTMSGGAINSGSWFVVGRDRATGILNLNGGTITKGGAATTYIIIGSLGGNGTLTQTSGALNATAGGIRLGENTGTVPALGTLWDMQGGSSTVTGEINIGWRSSEATWNISGAGTNVTATGRLIVAAETNNNTINTGPIVNGAPIGTINMSGGTATFSGGDSRIGGDNSAVSAGAQGFVNVTGGTMNFGANVQFGAYGQGTLAISGTGAVNSTAGFPVVGRFAGSVGNMNVSGGTFTQSGATNFLIIGEEGTGTLNLTGGLVDVQNIRLGHAATGNGTLNLNGGTLATSFVQKTNAGSTALINLNGGTLRSKANAADLFIGFSSSQLDVQAGGAKFDTNGFNATITQNLNGVGGLTKQGNGALTLSGSSGYAGATLVNGGSLLVTGSLTGTSGVTVASGATLGGSGTINAPVAINAGGILAPGTSPGTLTTGSLSLDPLSSSTFELTLGNTIAGGGINDLVVVNGDLTLDGTLFITQLGGSLNNGDVYTLFDYSGTLIDNGLAIDAGFLSLHPGAFISIDTVNTTVLLTVPEPSTALAALAGATLLGLRRRRRA
jgi:autotransporter-associated beta strand protein